MNTNGEHRPWPAPDRPWAIAMTWHDLLFMHWPVPVESLRAIVPLPLEVDTFEGQAWIGIVPFRMTGIRHRRLPALPGLSAFQELNVRTYVKAGGRPGVLFFSLDADHLIGATTARYAYQLPYYWADMSFEPNGERIAYRSRRVQRGAPPAELEIQYRPTGDAFRARPLSLEHWLTERYRLYTVDHAQRVCCAEIHHQPWPLQPAEAEICRNTMTLPLNIRLPHPDPLVHFARQLEVVAWRLERLEPASTQTRGADQGARGAGGEPAEPVSASCGVMAKISTRRLALRAVAARLSATGS